MLRLLHGKQQQRPEYVPEKLELQLLLHLLPGDEPVVAEIVIERQRLNPLLHITFNLTYFLRIKIEITYQLRVDSTVPQSKARVCQLHTISRLMLQNVFLPVELTL